MTEDQWKITIVPKISGLPHVEQAAVILGLMGSTPDEVAQCLRDHKQTGRRDNPRQDPVCRLLRRYIPTDDIIIEYGEYFVNSGGKWERAARLTPAVDAFLGVFDLGEYPDLVE